MHEPTEIVARVPSASIPGIADVVHVRGDLLFVSGQVGMGADGNVPEDFADELDAAFRALIAALTRAGSSAERIVKLTYFVVDLPSLDLQAFRATRDRHVPELSASSLIGVSALFHPSVRVEIEAIAGA